MSGFQGQFPGAFATDRIIFDLARGCYAYEAISPNISGLNFAAALDKKPHGRLAIITGDTPVVDRKDRTSNHRHRYLPQERS